MSQKCTVDVKFVESKYGKATVLFDGYVMMYILKKKAYKTESRLYCNKGKAYYDPD